MQARVIDSEEPATNRPIKLVILTPNKKGEARMIQRMRNARVQTMKVIFGEIHRNEVRLIIPVEATE